jgi:hypothetical protein
MRPVSRREMVPDMERIETCLLRSASASEGDGTAGDRSDRVGDREGMVTFGGSSDVRIEPMDAIMVSL